MSEIRISEVPDKDLANMVLTRVRRDYDWRSEWLGGQNGTSVSGGEAFQRASELYEAWTSDNDIDADIPRVNLIHRAVEDFLSVALTNIPKVKMKADRFIGNVPSWERPLRLEIIQQAEVVMNAYIGSIMGKNQWVDIAQRAVTDAAIFGVGYVYTEVDESLDVARDYQVRDLMNKQEELTEEELDLLRVLAKRIDVKTPDPRNIFWRHSIRDPYDEAMNRVTVVEYFDTEALREIYADSPYLEGNTQLIRPGTTDFFLQSPESKLFSTEPFQTDSTTPLITYYEKEAVMMERVVEGEDGEEVTFDYTDWKMYKITLAGNALVDKQEWTSADGPLRLPIVPIYLRKSVNHPYGWSLPLALERSEQYINAIQTIIFKSARKAVSTQGVVVAIPNLGEGDLEELEYVLEEGGVARITGNKTQGPIDVRDMIMPLNYNQSPINPALIQAMNIQMDMFRNMSQEVDSGAVGSARSGAAKRAQIAVADRPKTISISFMSQGIEAVYDNIYELVRTFHNAMVSVLVDVPMGGREQVMLNETYERNMLVMDPTFESPDNPLGLQVVPFKATLNSVYVNMWAVADGRTELPLDMISKFQLGIALAQAGVILPETVREFSLNEEMKAFDDQQRNKKKAEEMEQQMQAMQQAQQMAQQQAQQNIQPQFGGVAPQFSPGGQIPAEAAGGIALQESQAAIDTNQGSPFATPSSPFAF